MDRLARKGLRLDLFAVHLHADPGGCRFPDLVPDPGRLVKLRANGWGPAADLMPLRVLNGSAGPAHAKERRHSCGQKPEPGMRH